MKKKLIKKLANQKRVNISLKSVKGWRGWSGFEERTSKGQSESPLLKEKEVGEGTRISRQGQENVGIVSRGLTLTENTDESGGIT